MGNAAGTTGWTCTTEGVSEECRKQVACNGDDMLLDRKYLNVQLIAGSRDGQVEVVREALKAGAQTETRQPMKILAGIATSTIPEKSKVRVEGPTPLMLAAKSGSVACIQLLLDARARINARDEDGLRPVHFAALSGELAALKVLLDAGANPQERDTDGLTAVDHLPEEVRRDAAELKRWREVLNGAAEARSAIANESASHEVADDPEDDPLSPPGQHFERAHFLGERLPMTAPGGVPSHLGGAASRPRGGM